MKTQLQNLLTAHPELLKLVHSKAAQPMGDALPSGHAALDRALAGGLPLAAISEWGIARGQQGREVILQFIAQAGPMTLWNYPPPLQVYPPLWQAMGIDLKRVFFAQSTKPLKELKALFIDPLFRLLVLDCPEALSSQDFAFMAHHARRNKQSILVLRPHLLQKPNPFAKLRVNSRYDRHREQFSLEVLRGAKPATVVLPKEDLSYGI